MKNLTPRPHHHQLPQNRHWFMSANERTSTNLQRHIRGTGFYIVRQGAYFVLIPDSKHHFSKNLRPYIGRRRR